MKNNSMKFERGHMGKTIPFSSDEDRNLFLQDFKNHGQMESIFNSWKHRNIFDKTIFNLKEALINELIKKNILNKNEFKKIDNQLEKIHLFLPEEKIKLDDTEQNFVSINFYEVSSELKDEYVKFISDAVAPLFPEPIYYQQVPTFRFHFPNQKGYMWQDRYHTDVMLGHPPYEFNVWLPFTDVCESNSMRLMSLNDSLDMFKDCKHDFEIFAKNVQHNENFIEALKNKSQSLDMKYGEFIIFDPRCLHCTQHNITNSTRISIDIRVIPENNFKKYSREYRSTGRKKMLFQPGHYFSSESVG